MPNSSQQNSVAERLIGVLTEMARALMQRCSSPAFLWREAILTAAYLHNLCPSKRLPAGVTPYELWYKEKPSYAHLRTFGCRAYATVTEKDRDKFGPQAIPCVFLGYSPDSTGYILYDPTEARLIPDSADVVFNEDEFPFEHLSPDDPQHDFGIDHSLADDLDYIPSDDDATGADIERQPSQSMH